MSLPTEQRQDIEKRWFRRKITWLIGIIILLGISLVVFVAMNWSLVPEVGGVVIIEADPDTRIYVGDKLVGTTSVVFSWGELFGDERHSGIALELLRRDQEITAEMLSGEGSTLLSQPSGINIVGNVHLRVAQGSSHLVRRADGTLDPVVALVLEWFPHNETPHSYLLPVRLRKGPTPSFTYFESDRTETIVRPPSLLMRICGLSPNESKTKCSFKASNPPLQFAEEIKSKGLWEPGGEK